MQQVTLLQASAQTKMQTWLEICFTAFFYCFLFLSILLPSGSIYHVNVKYPLYLGLLPLAIWKLFSGPGVSAKKLVGASIAMILLMFWLALGVSYGFPTSSIMRQFTDVLLLLLLCSIVSIFTGGNERKCRGFLMVVLYGVVSTALLKAALILYAVLTGTPLIEMLLLINKVFDVDLMTMDINTLVGRVQFYSDFLIPICVYMVLRYRERLRIPNLRASVIVILLLASAILSFSRYLWVFSVIGTLLGLLLGKRDRFQLVLLAFLGITVIACIPFLLQAYQLRFAAATVDSSDGTRAEQIRPLQGFFVDAPLFGHGFGSYTPTLLRADTEALRYSYEVQLVALAGQIGIVGLTAILIAAVLYFRRLWSWNALSLGDRLGIGIMLTFWLSAGFTNPLLFQSVAAINYALLHELMQL